TIVLRGSCFPFVTLDALERLRPNHNDSHGSAGVFSPVPGAIRPRARGIPASKSSLSPAFADDSDAPAIRGGPPVAAGQARRCSKWLGEGRQRNRVVPVWDINPGSCDEKLRLRRRKGGGRNEMLRRGEEKANGH